MARRERARRRREGELHRENVSGELEHASGEVDEFDAALVSGAQGQADSDPTHPPQEDLDLAAAAACGSDGDGDGDDKVPTHPVAGPRPGGNRFLNFLRASWAELQRVQWPDRRQVAQATGVVLGFVVLAGAYLGIADWAAQRVVNFVL